MCAAAAAAAKTFCVNDRFLDSCINIMHTPTALSFRQFFHIAQKQEEKQSHYTSRNKWSFALYGTLKAL